MIDLRLVPPSVWRPEVARYAEPATSSDPWADPARLAHAVLWVLQDAHVGITPKLAHELGRLFARKGHAEPGVWPKLFRRLQNHLPRTERSGLVPGNAPVYVALKLARPIVRQACAEIGYTCLLCQDEIGGAVTADDYARYGASLERIASRIAEQLADESLFATEHGNLVAALSEPSPDGRFRAVVPQIDRDSLALLLGLGADVDFPERASRSTRVASYVPRRRPAAAGDGGRVEGLRQGRGENDLGSMVLSELLNPPLVLADRLLNSGYLVHERRPRRAKLRDALVVGLMPPEVRASPQGAFAKACWLDCMVRLARRLSASGLQDSEFRWIEGDAGGRARHSSFSLSDVPAHLASAPHETFRDAFMTLTRLLPDYFETRKGFVPLKTDAVASDAEWSIAAHVGRDEREERGRPLGSPERFSFVHIMVFLPLIDNERSAAGDAARQLGTLRAGLRLGYRRRRHASVTYVPCTRDRDAQSWRFGTDADPYSALTPASDDGAALARLLQSAWLERLTKGIWHG